MGRGKFLSGFFASYQKGSCFRLVRYFFFSSGPRPFINFLEFCATYSVGILVCLIVPKFAFPVDQIIFVYFFKIAADKFSSMSNRNWTIIGFDHCMRACACVCERADHSWSNW